MIIYKKGDATDLDTEEKCMLVHICNNIGLWGKGFVLALSKRWDIPEKEYRGLDIYRLGTVQYVSINNLVVGNMIAQDGVNSRFSQKKCRVDYDKLRLCLESVNEYILKHGMKVIHMPKIGTGLAMGNWSTIVNIIEDSIDKNIVIYVYTN